jgi:phage shock protein A
MPEPTLEVLQALALNVLTEQQETRRDMRDIRTLILGLLDQGQRFDRRFAELDRRMSELRQEMHEMKDDLSLMLKAEVVGRIGHFETQTGHRLDELTDRVAALEVKP